MEQQMKEETKNKFLKNQNLIKSHTRFLELLFRYAKLNPSKSAGSSDDQKSETLEIFLHNKSIECMCQLYSQNPKFNNHQKIIQFLVYKLNSKSCTQKQTISNMIQEIFDEDLSLENVMLIIQAINTVIKKKDFLVDPLFLEVTFYFNLAYLSKISEEGKAIKQREKEAQSRPPQKMNRNKVKKMKKLQKELEAANAKYDRSKSAKMLQKIMELLFFMYFKALKVSKDEKIILLSFKGIAMYSHLLNIDFFSEIIECFANFVKNDDYKINFRLKCLSYFFEMLKSIPDSEIIDYSSFYDCIFNLFPLADYSDPAIIECLIKISKNAVMGRLKSIKKDFVTFYVLLLQNVCFLCSSKVKTELTKHVDQMLNLLDIQNKIYTVGNEQEPLIIITHDMNKIKSLLSQNFWSQSLLNRIQSN